MADENGKTTSAPNAPRAPVAPSHAREATTLPELEARVKKIEHQLHETQKLAHSLAGHTAPPPPESW